MKRLLIATHGYLADGYKSSLGILTGMQDEIEYLDAYVDESDYTPKIDTFIDSVGATDQGVIFTDIYGGSVCQKVALELQTHPNPKVFHISGINLGLVIEILLSDDVLDVAYLNDVIDKARNSMRIIVPEQVVQKPEADDFFE